MQKTEHGFLKGGGEMAGLIAAYDWSKNPLGEIGSWPESLRTSLSMMLRSRFPMVIFWGPKLITFYNDAFRPSLGKDGKHPGSLGQVGEKSWAETWPVIGPMINDIMAGGDAVWFEDQKLPIHREGQIEYAYWTYSLSAITNGEGTIEGLLVTCAETTKTVESLLGLNETNEKLATLLDEKQASQEKQLKAYLEIHESQKRMLALFEQSPVAIATIVPENLTFTSANPFYGELVGRKPEDIVGKPLLEALPEIAGQGFDDLLRNVLDTGIAYLADEVPVNLVRQGKMQNIYVNLAYQPIIESDASISGILVVATHVTAQVQARKTIEQSEQKFRSLVEEAPVATCLFTGPHHVVEVANDIMLDYWGKTKSIIGMPVIEAIPELKGQPFIEILDEVYRTGKPFTATAAEAQLSIDGKLGTYYFDFTYKPLFDENGKVYGIMDMAVDVTEQRNARKALEESELFARSVIDHSPVAKIVFTGPEMTLKTVNRSMLDLLQKNESIIGQTYYDVFPELRHTHLPETMLHVFNTGETFTQPEERIELMKNGKLQSGYYSYIYKALRNTEGIIYGIIVTANDITDQVKARHKIEEAESRLNGAVELAELSTWSIDLSNNQITYSPRLQEWLGITDALYNEDMPRIANEDKDRVRAAIAEAIKPEGKGRFDEIYSIVNTKTGHQRIIHSHARLIRDETGKPMQLTGVAQDVTLQKELQVALENEVQQRTMELASTNEELAAINEELEDSNRNLVKSNAELEQYAYVASHDLQEPLRKIQIFSTMLDEQKDLAGSHRKYVEKINRSAARMSMLIKDLLEFSRLLSEGDKTKKSIDLNKIVSEVTNDFELLIAEKNAEVEIGELPTLEAVGLQMNQLFYNLIGNALKFVKQGVKPHIVISSREIDVKDIDQNIQRTFSAKTYHRISVSDNGIGIDPEHANQIFQVFKRLHSKEIYEGSGIGLALCSRIVNNHNGYLYHESTLGTGSTFHIILPG